jgi:hypothetical protein
MATAAAAAAANEQGAPHQLKLCFSVSLSVSLAIVSSSPRHGLLLPPVLRLLDGTTGREQWRIDRSIRT